MSHKKKIIAVAEMSHIIRKGLVYVLSQHPLVDKVVEWKDTDNGVVQLGQIQPDALVINPMLLGRISKNEIRQRLKLEKKTVVIALVYNMIDDAFYQSYDAVLRINDSETDIQNTLSRALKQKKSTQSEGDSLSEREMIILRGLVKGLSAKDIAELHNISVHTVITHRRNISRKLDIHSISGLTIYAIINKLVDINEIEY